LTAVSVIEPSRTLASQIQHVDGRVEIGALPILQASRPGAVPVFHNLIANAFKFHNGDPPHVIVSARHGEAGWAFSVRDNGIGLPKNSAIFEMLRKFLTHSRLRRIGARYRLFA
jgi:light-regulated signal transduction histidine kinase (bacteriophytochrome)